MSESQTDDELESQTECVLPMNYDEFCDKFRRDVDDESDDELESQTEPNRVKFHGAMADELAEKHVHYNPF